MTCADVANALDQLLDGPGYVPPYQKQNKTGQENKEHTGSQDDPISPRLQGQVISDTSTAENESAAQGIVATEDRLDAILNRMRCIL
jgi:hypothetical protein